MAKKPFNLGEFVDAASSKMDTMPRMTAVELHLIDAAPGNFYSMEGIDSLADNIAMFGLMQPLQVREKDGRYIVVSGHRRREAMRKLIERGEMDPHDKVPVFLEPAVDTGEARDADAARVALQQLRLIYANADNRQYTPADKLREVRELTGIFTELRRLGYEFPGKTREQVAAAAKISESRVARLSVIGKNLTTPNLRAAFDAGRLGENAAYEIARRSADVIGRVDELPMAVVCDMTLDRLGAVLDGLEQKAAEDAAEVKAYNDGVAAMTDAQPATPYRGREEVEEYLAKRKEEDADYLDMMTARMDGIIDQLPLIDNRQDGIASMKKAMRWSSTGGSTVNWEGRGNGFELESRRRGIEPILRSWTEAYDALCCAALNRLGKMNANKRPPVENGPSRAPAPTWQTGTPKEVGWYACWAQWVDKYKGALPTYDPDYETLFWNGAIWTNGLNSTKDAGFTVHYWYRLPPEPGTEDSDE